MIDTNVKGVVYMCKAVVPGMRERNSGHIININRYLSPCPSHDHCRHSASTIITITIMKFVIILPPTLFNQSIDVCACSISGSEAYAGGGVYCATKFAITAISDSLRKVSD